MYDEVTEDVALEIQRKRIREEDFVVDDDGNGYMENGQEMFDEQASHSEEESDDEAPKKKRKKSKIVPKAQRIETYMKEAQKKVPTRQTESVSSKVNVSDDMVNHLLEKATKEVQKHSTDKKHDNAKELQAKAMFATNVNEPEITFDDAFENIDIDEGQVKVNKVSTAKSAPSARGYLPEFEPVVAPSTATVINQSTVQARNWQTLIDDQPTAVPTPTVAPTLPGAISPEHVLEEDGSLNFFWFDAYEGNQWNSSQRGLIYLFGKVLDKQNSTPENPRFVSCCLTVNGQQRNIFVLPRAKRVDLKTGVETDEDVDLGMVYEEMEALRQRLKIKSWKCKPVKRNYAFELENVPVESDYFKVVYGFDQPELTADSVGETFSMIFGTKTSSLEHLLLKRKIMGPCWLKIATPEFTTRTISWCKLEVAVSTPKQIAVLEEDRASPPFVVMCLSMKTYMNKQSNEVVMMGAHIYSQVSVDGAAGDAKSEHSTFTVVRKMDGMPLPNGFKEAVDKHNASGSKIEVCPSERAALNYFIAQLQRYDPDVLVGHNFIGFDLDVLLHRMKHHKVDHWSRLGRLRRTVWPKMQAGAGGHGDATFEERQIATGRLLCDTYLAAKEHILKAKSYSMTNLALSELDIQRQEINFDQLPSFYWETPTLMHLIKHTTFDAMLAAMLMFKIQILPLSKQLTNLAGNLWSKTITGARADRNEHLLLHEFHNKKYIVPDKVWKKGKQQVVEGVDDDDDDKDQRRPGTTGRRKPAYSGGLVLEPKKGFYDKFVLMLDFNSLYPSIIQEYNIDFSTVVRHYDAPTIAQDGTVVASEDVMPALPEADAAPGVLPRLLKTLVDRRRQIKNLMKEKSCTESQLAQYEVRQRALKLTANSMYGCLGFSHSRFYAKPIAMLITSKGREILQATVDLAEQGGLEVIYGDTGTFVEMACRD